MHKIVIIGGGHAAAQIVTSLRLHKLTPDHGYQTTLISSEPHLPYQRPPLSKAYLKGELTAERLLIQRDTAYESAGVTLKLGVDATALNAEKRTVTIQSPAGTADLAYDTLILATGGHARALNCPGGALTGIYSVRTLKDIDTMAPAFHRAKHIAVIGGGYIGLEAASVARELGKDVTLLEAEDRLLARAVAQPVSDYFKALHSRHGVTLKLGAKVTEIEAADTSAGQIKSTDRAEHPLRVTYETASTSTDAAGSASKQASIEADLVLVGIGLVPNTQLAESAGLATDHFGICVNAQCQTSDPHIYAVGDVASFTHPVYGGPMRLESVPNAVEQAKVAVANIAGTVTNYDAQPWFWSDQYGLRIQIVGLSAGADTVVTRGDTASDSAAFFYLKDGKLIAADCIARVQEFMIAKKLITAGIAVDPTVLADDSAPFKEQTAHLLAK